MVAIVEYGAGNIRSLSNAIERIGEDYVVTSDPSLISTASHIVLPGVGQAASVICGIEERNLTNLIRSLSSPVLGICIGMQVLCSYSEEGDTGLLDVFDNRVVKLRSPGLKIPHMGWNRITGLRGPLFESIPEGEWFYFVHSYAPEISLDTVATTDYGGKFSSALNRRNFYGVQFHPEKSGQAGERFLKNFFNIDDRDGYSE